MVTLWIAPLLALLGGALVPAFRSRRARMIWTGSVTLLSSLAALWIALRPDRGGLLTLCQIGPGLALSFRLDGTGRVFLLLIAFLWPLATLYATAYMRHEKREGAFFTFYTLTFGVTQLVALSANLFTLYLMYECLTLITLPLVTHHEDGESLKAGMIYLRYSIGGAALGLTGLIALTAWGATGGFVRGGILSPAAVSGQDTLLQLVFLLSFVGFSAKAALFPLSVWLPRVSVAPTPVTALLHAVAVVNAGAFAAIRLIYDCFGTALLSGTWAQQIVLLLSCFTILLGAVMAIREQHLKRRLAWSTVSNLSYILFSACLMTEEGLTGALAHLVFHGLIKITLFYCAGAFMVCAGREYLSELRGTGRDMPFTAVVFTLSGIALTGIPPLAGFISKWTIVSAAVQLGTPAAWAGAAVLMLSSVMGAVYLLSPALQMFYHRPGEKGIPPRARRLDPGPAMLIPLTVLTLLILWFGVASGPLMSALRAAASGL